MPRTARDNRFVNDEDRRQNTVINIPNNLPHHPRRVVLVSVLLSRAFLCVLLWKRSHKYLRIVYDNEVKKKFPRITESIKINTRHSCTKAGNVRTIPSPIFSSFSYFCIIRYRLFNNQHSELCLGCFRVQLAKSIRWIHRPIHRWQQNIIYLRPGLCWCLLEIWN